MTPLRKKQVRSIACLECLRGEEGGVHNTGGTGADPTFSEWGLIVMGVLLAGGIICFGRRRVART